jgi:DNA-binding transcriptional LysR family regulator
MYDVRRLRLLRELAARGTVTAVAEALAYTPSAVSQQLAQLEREAGVELLERVGRGVRLTDAAVGLVDHTEAVLARLEQAEAELASTGGEVQGTVRVAAFQTAARSLVAPILRPLAERHPRLRCEMIEMEAEEALPHLRVGDIDMVVAEEYPEVPRPRDPALERLDIARDRLVLALREDHPAAAGGGPVPLAELAGDPWCTTREGTLFGDVLSRVCRTLGDFEPDVRHRANDVHILIQMAAEGHAIALVPSLGQPGAEGGVAVRAVAGAELERVIFAAVRRGGTHRPSVAAVLEALRERAARVAP